MFFNWLKDCFNCASLALVCLAHSPGSSAWQSKDFAETNCYRKFIRKFTESYVMSPAVFQPTHGVTWSSQLLLPNFFICSKFFWQARWRVSWLQIFQKPLPCSHDYWRLGYLESRKIETAKVCSFCPDSNCPHSSWYSWELPVWRSFMPRLQLRCLLPSSFGCFVTVRFSDCSSLFYQKKDATKTLRMGPLFDWSSCPSLNFLANLRGKKGDEFMALMAIWSYFGNSRSIDTRNDAKKINYENELTS